MASSGAAPKTQVVEAQSARRDAQSIPLQLLPEIVPLTSDEKRRLFLPERFSEAQRKEIEKAWSQLDKPAHEMTWHGAPG